MEEGESGEGVRGDPLDGHFTVTVDGKAWINYVLIEVTDVALLKQLDFAATSDWSGRSRALP